jgi:hypothetical protein
MAIALSTASAALPVKARARPAGLGMLLRLVLADVLERTRRPGYLVSLLAMLWLGQHMLPPSDAPYRTMVLHDLYRPVYNAAWVGTLTAMLTGMWFALIGFYQVKGSVERDRRTGVGQVLAASRLGSFTYLSVRMLGNAAVFASQAAMVLVAALIQQQVLGEDRHVDLWASASPFLVIAGPMALMVSAAAVLFDCIRPLRGGLGNIAWFFLFAFFMAGTRMDDPNAATWRDFSGTRVVVNDVRRELARQHPETASSPHEFSMGVNFSERFRTQHPVTFAWPGMRWTWGTLATRLPWLAFTLALLLVANTAFDRFASAPRPVGNRGFTWRWPGRATRQETVALPRAAHDLVVARRGFAALGLLRAELALLLKSPSPWWYVIVAGLWIAQLAAPLKGVREIVLPLASFWPALVWSALGQRERRDATGSVLFSCPRPVSRQLPMAWLAGAIVMLLAGAPALLRLAGAGEWLMVGGWALGAAFVPALALCSGIWSGGRTLFEVLYLFAWYAGPMQRIDWLDYTGVTTARSSQLWLIYGATAAGLLVLAALGRARQARG